MNIICKADAASPYSIDARKPLSLYHLQQCLSHHTSDEVRITTAVDIYYEIHGIGFSHYSTTIPECPMAFPTPSQVLFPV